MINLFEIQPNYTMKLSEGKTRNTIGQMSYIIYVL